MALRNASNGSSRGERNESRTPHGAVRRTQMITTYGVGSLVALGDQSFIVSGLDTWRSAPADAIYEPNLQHWLGVREFRLPPAASPPKGDGVKIRRFPQWYSCGSCRDLQPFGAFGARDSKSVCGSCGTALTPSRFVIACTNGHLDEFPYWAWVHNKTSSTESASKEKHDLTLESAGGSASLRSIIIKCSCGKRASMEGAFGRYALHQIGVKCSGRRPWLGKFSEESGCEEPPRALQRGSSAAWFPVQRSSLSIPPWSRGIQRLLNTRMEDLVEHEHNKDTQTAVIKAIIKGTSFSVDQVLAALKERQKLAGEEPDGDDLKLDASSRLRHKEYEQLVNGTTQVTRDDEFECEPAPLSPATPTEFDKVMLVKRLREVRALQSFTRIESPDPGASARPAELSLGELPWLPAIEVSGEGVFLTLKSDQMHRWENSEGPVARASQIHENHSAQLRRRAQLAGRKYTQEDVTSPVDARFILLHTLAHALINEWSLDSGYPAAALRERIYCSRGSADMAGILIYTATSDSAGSLGGVVGQGEPHRLRASLDSALDRISWCSQDPPCMESEASGTDSLNLAACYACVLLPETSCETNNTFLDRALLIGTPEYPEIGFLQKAG